MKPRYIYLVIILLFSCSKKKTEESSKNENPYYYQAYDYYAEHVRDSAFLNFSRAEEVFKESNDSTGVANCLVMMGIIQNRQGDYFGAQETALEALLYLNTEEPEHFNLLSTNYNSLGLATSQLGEKEKAITFYYEAIEFSADSNNVRTYLNNIGRLYQDKEDYPRAISTYGSVLKSSNLDSIEFARALTNYATATWESRKNYNPVAEFSHALDIRKQKMDLWGQNSSYAHFADYYEKVNRDSSLYYARQQYAMAKRLKSPEDQVKALKRLIRLNPVDSIPAYFATYQTLTDSIQQARAAAKNQFALIRYEVEKNKSENLRLQKDNAETTNRLIGLSITFILVGAGSVLWYKKRRQRLELETQNKIKASHLKTSRKVHDVVANGIYRVMTEIEHKEDIDRNGILDRLEDMYHKSRDISYEAEKIERVDQPFNQEVTNLLQSFASSQQKIIIAGNEPELWEAVKTIVQQEVKHILQELMVNMKKHSQAENVVIRFSMVDHYLHMHYKDDGVGLPRDMKQGNGLASTGNRIKNICGDITFASEPGKGLRVEVIIPTL
ncbi:tetratricopeptide repeat-containing sensor histidine kinase [Sphingobacterium deserti]|uniref:Histidine kinase n=1 Tax=Sphingobacterium deserti TaxID=1229276 RepID=A0A0B8T044_9SPHI|nr:tetratricopeptide repeat-containing sensor histidine kinase [Sphingobacterium deserti]KGE13496.1 histidine kinase [Sphingobacterium deserti]